LKKDVLPIITCTQLAQFGNAQPQVKNNDNLCNVHLLHSNNDNMHQPYMCCNTHCVPKSSTQSSINNFANSQRIFKIPSLANSLGNLQQNYGQRSHHTQIYISILNCTNLSTATAN